MHTYLSNAMSFYYSWRTFLLEIGADYTVISYFSMASGIQLQIFAKAKRFPLHALVSCSF